MRLMLACRVFLAALFQASVARRLEDALREPMASGGDKPSGAAESAQPSRAGAGSRVATAMPQAAPVSGPRRSEALTLLSALQREARWLDLVQEQLAGYSDAQIGAAARDVLRNCAGVLERYFGLRPAADQEEGSRVEVPRGYDPQLYRLVGNVSGEPPFRGQLVHRGWLATRCDLPAWSGHTEMAMILAPQEVEVGASG